MAILFKLDVHDVALVDSLMRFESVFQVICIEGQLVLSLLFT